MQPRERLTAVVLGDGQRNAATASALAARGHAGRVLIAERDPDTAAALAELALPADIAVLGCDWNDPEAAAALLAGVDSEWAVFLGPGEALLAGDDAALAREMRSLPAGPVELSVGARAETRLHPPTTEALAAVGMPAALRMKHLSIGPLPHDIALPAPCILDSVEPAAAGFGVWAAELPPAVSSARRLRGALRGSDLDALEHLTIALDRHEERRMLAIAREGRETCWTDEGEAEPLVTIRIATYHRPELIGRAIESCLAQTYPRLDVLVVGDQCSDETAAVVRGFRDERLRFVNLPARGMYPTELMARWRVAGVHPANAALLLGHGSWITACDDDDEFTPDHVEVLLRAAREQRLEMVWSKADMEVAPGRWEVVGDEPLREGHVTQGSVLYSMGLRFLRFSNTCWRREQPSDFNQWSRMAAIGVRMGFVDRVTYRHTLETHQRARQAAAA